MKSLPTGTVTSLFADIEESTRVLQLGDRYAEVLASHHRLFRTARAKSWKPKGT